MQEKGSSLLTINEAAHFLNVTESCLRRMLYERRISAVKIGRCVRFEPDYLAKYVVAHTKPAAPMQSDNAERSQPTGSGTEVERREQ